MKTIFVKELQENAKWALLMLVGVGLLLGHRIYLLSQMGVSNAGMSLGSDCAMGFAAAGFILGLLQILQDSRRGRWQFVIHRPISRSAIFGGKVLAGLVLYPLITGIPLAIVLWWLMTPGNLAQPFYWEMALPRIGELVTGLVWYFAGLCVGARSARWIGSRLAPMGLAMLITLGSYLVMQFSTGLLIIGAGLLVLVPTAWFIFTAGGEFESQPVASRGLQTIVVGTGVVIVTAAVFFFARDALYTLILRPEISSQGYELLKDGRVVRVGYGAAGVRSVTDLNGVPVDKALIGPDAELPTAYVGMTEWNEQAMPYGIRVHYFGYESDQNQLLQLGYTYDDQVWYYVPSRRTLEGYDAWSRRYIGCMGPDGFISAPQPPQPFPEPLFSLYNSANRVGSTPSMMCGSTTAYFIDLRHHSIRRAFSAGADDRIIGVGDFPALAGRLFGDESRNAWVVVARSGIHIFDYQFSPVLQTTIAIPSADTVTVGQMADGRYATVYSTTQQQPRRRFLETIQWLSEDGKQLSQIDLPALDLPVYPESAGLTAFAYMGCPGGLALVCDLLTDTPPTRPETVCAIILSLVAVGVTVWLSRRYSFGRGAAVVWGIVNLLLGLPGVLVMLSIRNRPARVRCKSCGSWRVVNRQKCEHCGSGFEAPIREGIEIFEGVGDSAALSTG